MAFVKARYLALPYQDSPESGRLILRDGTTATIRLSRPEDKEALRTFFVSLSQMSRLRRFFSFSGPNDKLIESFCDSSNPRAKLTLVVTRYLDEVPGIIATGTYVARDDKRAEIALTVDDEFHGKGLGTLLLERLRCLP